MFLKNFSQKVLSNFKKYGKADLVIGNNVYAHVLILMILQRNKIILNVSGVVTLEFPHILNLIQEKQFDTIYHEHFLFITISSEKIFNFHV